MHGKGALFGDNIPGTSPPAPHRSVGGTLIHCRYVWTYNLGYMACHYTLDSLTMLQTYNNTLTAGIFTYNYFVNVITPSGGIINHNIPTGRCYSWFIPVLLGGSVPPCTRHQHCFIQPASISLNKRCGWLWLQHL